MSLLTVSLFLSFRCSEPEQPQPRPGVPRAGPPDLARLLRKLLPKRSGQYRECCTQCTLVCLSFFLIFSGLLIVSLFNFDNCLSL